MSKLEHILYLKDQILRFAAPKNHKHVTDDVEDLNSKYATKKHTSTNANEIGAGTKDVYGHVKVDDEVKDSSNPVQNTKIKEYIDTAASDLNADIEEINDKIDYQILKSTDGINSSSTDKQLPTALTVWEALTSYDDILNGVTIRTPSEYGNSLETLTTPGYYIYKKDTPTYFIYGGEQIFYNGALIEVRANDGHIIQYVYATEQSTQDGNTIYRLNGEQYTRWKKSTGDWKAWHCAHKPYKETTRVSELGENVDAGSVTVHENTAGFIIRWNQSKQPEDQYPISAPLYQYAKVCDFYPPLPIKGPYVFGNLIGRYDIKITSSKMEIRSNIPPTGRIIGVHETYFVPRNQ